MNEPNWNDPNVRALGLLTDGYVDTIFQEVRAFNLLALDFDKGSECLRAVHAERSANRTMFHYIVDNCPVR